MAHLLTSCWFSLRYWKIKENVYVPGNLEIDRGPFKHLALQFQILIMMPVPDYLG